MKFIHALMKSFTFRLVTLGSGMILTLYLACIAIVIGAYGGNAVLPSDCAVVFGSAVHRSEFAGPGIRRRIQAAVELLRKGSVKTLIFTGGTGEGNLLSEARVMRNEALRYGIDPEVIRMEEGATSTWQNIKFAKPFTHDCGSIVAISDRYHLARIRMIAWKQGVSLTTYPSGIFAKPLFEGIAVMREALGLMVYAVVF